jgi:hypothetical protein
MIEGHPFLFQSTKQAVYHVTEDGVKEVGSDYDGSWDSKEPIVALIDGDKGDFKPNEMLLRPSVQLVVASSPKVAHQKWIEQIGHASSITQLAIKLWSRKELFLTGLVLLSIAFNSRLMPL